MDVESGCDPKLDPAKVFPQWVRASVLRDGKLTPHPCGVYPQEMAVDPVTKLAAIPYDVAEDLGYLKVDLLHLQIYGHLKDRAELEELLKKEPDWKLLQVPSVQKKLFQLSKHGELLSDIKPNGLEEVADVLALIRPGKKALLGLYKKDRVMCRRALYAQDESGYAFKRSHSLSYAYVIWLQLHLIEQGRL